MHKVAIIGNPNVGKSTFFNSITKSNEHTGNFHGVTVEEKSKVITLQNEQYEIFDLPGMYSLNSYSYEEQIAKNFLLNNQCTKLVLIDANSLSKNLYLCLQLQELGFDFKVLINNYDYFIKQNNKLNIKKLQNKLNLDIEIINAKKIKLNKNILKIKNENKNVNNIYYLQPFINKIKNKFNLQEKQIIKALNGIFENLTQEQITYIKSLYPELVEIRHHHICKLIEDCVMIEPNYVYGRSKVDKLLLKPIVMIVGFLLCFFTSFYVIFFLLGPLIGDLEHKLLEMLIINPFMNLLYMSTDNVWLIEFFNAGVFNSISTVISFIPQVMLLFMFLTVLEDSGIISRMAYVFDDFLTKLGLNGKAIYIMLLGFGCNTMSTTATRNMNSANLKTKTAIVNPYVSCMARLPVYTLIASAFFGKISFLVVFGLYVLGIAVALIMAFILNKTILKTEAGELLLEFPPLRGVDIKHILKVGKINAVDFFKRIFTVILTTGVIIWVLSHTMFNFTYTQDISQSILYFFADKIAFIFAPIGLNSAGIVCALIVGILAKELIVSTISICNNVQTQSALIASLLISTNVINFTLPSAVSFLIFSSIYCPCASNLAVIKKETNKFYMWFSMISQFLVAYMTSFVVYQMLTKGFVAAILLVAVIGLIMFSIVCIFKKVKKNKCLSCGKCK